LKLLTNRIIKGFLTPNFKGIPISSAYSAFIRGRKVPTKKKSLSSEGKTEAYDMQSSVTKPVWAGHVFRVDPTNFPQQVCYAARDSVGDVSITIDRRGAVLRKTLPASSLPLSIALPARAFNGVAARAIDHGNGHVTVTLELFHDDPDLCIPLLVSHDLEDIAADWRTWSDLFSIPMLMIEADGVARPLHTVMGDIKTQPVKPRRRHSFFAGRRPRFLVRRSMGSLGLQMRIDGREIIARS
jgi:Family of unknown function (DUF6101)